jgi:hypothetical protein
VGEVLWRRLRCIERNALQEGYFFRSTQRVGVIGVLALGSGTGHQGARVLEQSFLFLPNGEGGIP